jgi:hypothetical protein
MVFHVVSLHRDYMEPARDSECAESSHGNVRLSHMGLNKSLVLFQWVWGYRIQSHRGYQSRVRRFQGQPTNWVRIASAW